MLNDTDYDIKKGYHWIAALVPRCCWRWVCAGGRGCLVHGTAGHLLNTKVCTIKLWLSLANISPPPKCQKFCNFDLPALQVQGNGRMESYFLLPFLILIYKDGKNQGGEKPARCPLLFNVRFSSRHINNVLSRLSPLPLGPAAVRLSYCRAESALPLAYYVQGRIVDKCSGACLTALFLPPSLPSSVLLPLSLQWSGSEDGCSTGLSGAVFGGLSWGTWDRRSVPINKRKNK